MYNGVAFRGVTSKGIEIITKEGETITLEADTVMVVNKYRKNTNLYDALEGRVPERYLIGDAKSDQRRYIRGAINEGARVGLAI